jgi:hypothetical protein
MEVYRNAELADAHMMYGLADGKGAAAQRLYRETFPERRCPDRKTFEAIDRHLREHVIFKPNTRDWGRPRSTRTLQLEEAILLSVNDDPSASTRQVAATINVDHMTVWRKLHENLMYPYHLQRVQGLSVADFPARRHLCEWFIQQCVNHNFNATVLFTDEASFQQDQIVNFHNQHVWADVNPHVTVEAHHQQRFSVNVWAGIVGNYLIGPKVLPQRLNGQTYHNFVENVLSEC